MADIFTEVDEALKQERLENLWKKYGGVLIFFLAALVAGTAANSGYKAWVENKETAQTAKFLDVTEQESIDINALTALMPDLDPGLSALATLKAANVASENGDMAQATDLFAKLSTDKKAPENLQKLAAYMVVQTSSDMDTEQKLASLQAMASDDMNPWHMRAKLDAALILGEKKGDYAAAIPLLEEITNTETAPKTLRQKAHSIKILYALKEQ